MISTAMVLWTALLCLGSADEVETLDREVMLELVRGLHSPVVDIDLRFEGSYKRLVKLDLSGLPDAIRKASESAAARNENSYFQGSLAYRDDWSVHLDLYDRPEDGNGPLRRSISCLLRGKYSERSWIPDQGRPTAADKSEPGVLLDFQKSKSPFWFFLYPILELNLKNKSDSMRYRFVGWQKVDGQKCAVVEFSMLDPDTGKTGWAETYFVDMLRGGHPLRGSLET